MEHCKTVEDGVRAVLRVYETEPECRWSYRRAGEGELTDVLTLDGRDYPLLWWRFDTQTSMLHEMAPSREPCSMKLNRSCGKSEGLSRLTYRELDIAQWVLGTEVRTAMCFENGEARNVICTMENGCTAVFELAAALCDGTEEQGRHTFWGRNGMASDRVVSQKVPSEATYLFTDGSTQPETYNDVFRCMYGLEKPDAVRACAVAEALFGRVDPAEWLRADAQLRRCLDAVERSARTGEKEAVR